jgi:hypothetical protein
MTLAISSNRLANPVRRAVVFTRARRQPSARRVGARNMNQRWVDNKDDAARRTAALMGFIVILVLAIAGVVLVRELTKKSRLEDCLMAGRHNCAPIEAPPRHW